MALCFSRAEEYPLLNVNYLVQYCDLGCILHGQTIFYIEEFNGLQRSSIFTDSTRKVNDDNLGLFLCESPFDFCHIIRPRELTSVPMSILTHWPV